MAPLIWKQSYTSQWILTAFELFLPDWWLVINSFILLKSMPHYHPNISPSREKLRSQAVKIFALQLHRLVKLKESASDTLRMALQKLRKKKKMNYVRSLWILHRRGWCPICPSFPLSDKRAIGMRSHWHNTVEVNSSPLFLFAVITVSVRCRLLWVFQEKSFGRDKRRRDDHTVIEWDLYLESRLG